SRLSGDPNLSGEIPRDSRRPARENGCDNEVPVSGEEKVRRSIRDWIEADHRQGVQETVGGRKRRVHPEHETTFGTDERQLPLYPDWRGKRVFRRGLRARSGAQEKGQISVSRPYLGRRGRFCRRASGGRACEEPFLLDQEGGHRRGVHEGE